MSKHRAINPSFTFTFVGETGQRYSRQHFWENLYDFSYGKEHVLVATRVVPHNNAQFTLYEMLKSGAQGESFSQLLPDGERFTQRALESGNVSDLIGSITELVPDSPATIPQEILAEAEKQYEKAILGELVNSGIDQGLDVFSDPGGIQSLGKTFSSTDFLHHTGTNSEDNWLVNLSFRVDRVLKEQMRKSLSFYHSSEALASHSDFEFEVYKRLYSKSNYLAFVRRLLDVPGGYISPVVRDFLSFYAKCLNKKLKLFAQESDTDVDILRKRVEGILGREKGSSHFFLNYHELTILGYVIGSRLPRDRDDPDSTDYSFKVDSSIDLGTTEIREIEDTPGRFLMRKFVEYSFNTHHNVEKVQFIDESLKQEAEARRKGSPTLLESIENYFSFAVPFINDEKTRSILYLLATGMVAFAFLAIAIILGVSMWQIH